MSWFLNFMNSSIGKKMQMAITGILLCLFLIVHVIGNLVLFAGPHAFNTYVETLSSVKPLVRALEVVLALVFIWHIFNGVRLTIENRKATPEKYLMNKAAENSKLTSRTMGLTGSLIFIFLVTHLGTIWRLFQLEHGGGKFYDIIISGRFGFDNIYYTFIYIFAMALLGFHLRHGFQSAFQTFGWNHSKYQPLISCVAVFFWLIIPLAFMSIPIYFGLLGGGN
jgi:succinate dehydrogenase / fumarate reductase, cytochrome b subunit